MISVIVYAEHSNAFLDQCLRSLAGLPDTEPPFEVLVADSGNAPERPEFASALVAVLGERFRYLPARGETRRPALLNGAILAARGDILAFTHDDTRVPPGWLDALTRPLALPGMACASGEDLLPPDCRGGFPVSLDYVLRSPFGSGGMRRDRGLRFGAFSPRSWNMAVHNQVMAELGGFDPDAGEVAEAVLAASLRRAGHRLAHVPEAVVHHARETTLAETTRLNLRRGREAAARWRRGMRLAGGVPYLIAAGATLLLGMALVATLAWPAARPYALAAVAAYAAPLVLLGLHAAWSWRRPEPLGWVPLLMASQHLGHGAGFLAGLVREPAAGARTRLPQRSAP